MKRWIVGALIFGLIAGLCAVTPAAAGQPHDRNGFFIGFGLGLGSAGWQDADERTTGGIGNFRIGSAVAPNVTIGFESSTWVKQEEVLAVGLGNVDLTLMYAVYTFGATYFPGNEGVYIKGGVGFGVAMFETIGTIPGIGVGKIETDDTGFGLLGAVGYEFRLTRKFAMGPEVEFAYLNVGGTFKSADYVSGSLMFNWYW